jgi:tRNA(Ile2) C34 agmatinyltransferase TiaS
MHDHETGGMANNKKEPVQDTCVTCGHELDARGKCPQCANMAVLAKQLRIKQRILELFREIDRIVANGW